MISKHDMPSKPLSPGTPGNRGWGEGAEPSQSHHGTSLLRDQGHPPPARVWFHVATRGFGYFRPFAVVAALFLLISVVVHAQTPLRQERRGATLTLYLPESDPPSMRLSDLLKLEIESVAEVEPPADITRSPGWRLHKKSKASFAEKGKRKVGKHTFWLEPLTVGEWPMQLEAWKIGDGKGNWTSVRWDEVTIKVTSIVAEPDLKTVRPLPGIEEVPDRTGDGPSFWPWLFAGACIITLAGLWMVRRLIRPDPAPKTTPRDWSLGQLRRLVAFELPHKNATTRFLRLLSLILRGYLERSLQVPARRLITSDLIPVLESLPQTGRDEIQAILERIDHVRYARLSITEMECCQLAQRAERFIMEYPRS